jgi:mono/diheme cytochrome c family protein
LRSWRTALIPVALVVAACSSSSTTAPPAPTEPIDTIAEIPESTSSTPPTSAVPATSQPPTDTQEAKPSNFSSEVMPILQQSCASCHTAEGPGAGHLLLESAGDAQANAKYIGAAIGTRYMPPWPAGDKGLAFHDNRRLTEAQIAAVTEWVTGGAAIDVAPEAPLTPTQRAITPIERDVVMTAQPYKGSSAKGDDYRCQIFEPNLAGPTFLRGFGFEPDNTQVVHHSLLYQADAITRAQYEQADADAPGVGWGCPVVTGPDGSNDIRQIMSWAPGQEPVTLPAGTGIAVEPGDFFVVQIHYHYEPKTDDLPPDESVLAVDLASDEEIAAGGGTLEPIKLKVYLGPAELPCSTKEVGPLCDREAAKVGLLERSGPFAALAADGLMGLCGKTLDDYAAMTDGIVTSTCELPAEPGQIVSVWGHMHYLGVSFRMTLNAGTPEERILLDIPKWDFAWQLDYEPSETVILDGDDKITIECVWDRAKIPKDAEPRYIITAEGTADEMCFSQIVTRPAPGTQTEGATP